MTNDPHHVVSAIAFALLHSLWEVAVLGLCAALSFTLMGRAAAWQRHTVGMAWLLTMFAAPLLTGLAYFQGWPVLTGEIGLAAGVSGSTGGGGMTAVPSWTDWILPGLAAMWLMGVAAMLALRWGGWRCLRRIGRPGAGILPAEWDRRSERLRASFGIARKVTIRAGARITMPFTAYAVRPVVWLPLGLLTRLPGDQLEALLAHELAHVRRLDWIWNLAQHWVESVLLYHPAMWWLSRRIREERELACDALAARVSGDPIALAEALATLQRERPRGQQVGLGLAAHGGALRRRVAHLVQDHGEHSVERHHGAAGLLLVAACLCFTLVTTVPMPHAWLINMQVRESMAGPLTAGNYREFSASYLFDARRDYRLNIDHQGRRFELYREDGIARPVDARTRSWVAAMSTMHSGQPGAVPGR